MPKRPQDATATATTPGSAAASPEPRAHDEGAADADAPPHDPPSVGDDPPPESAHEEIPASSEPDTAATATAVTPPPARDATATSAPRKAPRARTVALAIYAVCVVVYAAFANDRLKVHSPDNHFSYVADSYLHGQLSVRCSPADEARHICPPGGGGNDWARYRDKWFVTFPSFPGVVYMPAVAVWGRDFRNRAFDVLLAGLAPALLYLLLERLSREGRSRRSWRENLAFTALFAFGSVFLFTVVQGSVWYTAHLVACALAVGYVWFSLDAAHPLLAGVCLGLAYHTRASLLFAAPMFAWEAVRAFSRAPNTTTATTAGAQTRDDDGDPPGVVATLARTLRATDWPRALRAMALFALPVAAAIAVGMLLNKLRFGDASEVGYKYLQIRWRDRIERWGLFNYHYLGRNLGMALASLPWFTRQFPYVMISLHGLALWITTPHYLEILRLRRKPGDRHTIGLALAAAGVALSVLYQSTGWTQFGYRYSNDFAVFLIVLLAINGRRIGPFWLVMLAVAIAINAFGAATFEREVVYRGQRVVFYESDYAQRTYFQPD